MISMWLGQTSTPLSSDLLTPQEEHTLRVRGTMKTSVPKLSQRPWPGAFL